MSTMSGVVMHPSSNCMCKPYSTMVYLVNEFVYIHAALAMVLLFICLVLFLLITVRSLVPLFSLIHLSANYSP